MKMLHANMPRSSASPQSHRLLCCVTLLFTGQCVLAKFSQISDLKSKLSGVEELLEEFRKQLQQDQEHKREDGAGDECLNSYNAIEDYIIRARDSIELGATFLTAPARVYSWRDCLHACCSDPHCTVAVAEQERGRSEESLSCFLFNCTYRGRNICKFSLQEGYNSYSRVYNATLRPAAGGSNSDLPEHPSSRGGPRVKTIEDDSAIEDSDEPPRSDAGQDVVIQLPTDWAVLDGRDSVDDHGIPRYEWTLLQGDPSVITKVTQPGVLKLSGLQEGSYCFQLSVTDTAGQKSSDNVTITVLPPEHKAEACTGRCSRYQFMCDDGCCIDITYACDGKQQCPDRSDEAFCQSFDGSRKAVSHSSDTASHLDTAPYSEDGGDRVMLLGEPRKAVEDLNSPVHSYDGGAASPPRPHTQTEQDGREVSDHCLAPPAAGPCKGLFPRWYFDGADGTCKHFIYGGCRGNGNNFLQEADCVNECVRKPGRAVPKNTTDPPSRVESEPSRTARPDVPPDSGGDSGISLSKPAQGIGGHPAPESGAVVPLALGLAITALLLLMVACRLRLVRQKLKKARPITSEESDYLINGMYL
ncbi:low-density lipoprotein receptor-related protein 11 [Lepisosteus oculatus]|uniref:Low-density lipoprotein receptor-related protein 11 n=1 Tax=Lepisosteus oculatus TaxID=7918 RepID=W5NK69_LEPOC|nr:PREDICTED: low-density lipoprotein receptor-related protein 11 [Lepisosteus oculatus]